MDSLYGAGWYWAENQNRPFLNSPPIVQYLGAFHNSAYYSYCSHGHLQACSFCLQSEFSPYDHSQRRQTGSEVQTFLCPAVPKELVPISDARTHSCSNNHNCCWLSAFPFPKHLPLCAHSTSWKAGITWIPVSSESKKTQRDWLAQRCTTAGVK